MMNPSHPIEDYVRHPASEGRVGTNVLILRDGNVVGSGRIGSSRGDGTFHVYYNADTMPFAKEDEAVKVLNQHAGFKFWAAAGDYVPTYPDESEARGEGLSIVDAIAFEFGIASSLRYRDVRGFGVQDSESPDHYTQIIASQM